MKTRIDKIGITGVKVELTLPDLYVLKHTIDRINKLEELENEFTRTEDPSLYNSIRSESAEILSNLRIFLSKVIKNIQSPEDSNIFEEDKEDEIVL